MEPAIVKGYRLAFNMRGMPPLEPGMGSIIPTNSVKGGNSDSSQSRSSVPLYPYPKDECHGALICLTSEDYEKVMRSEGINTNVTNTTSSLESNNSKNSKGRSNSKLTGYEEVIVTAQPYDRSRPPVQAVALQVRQLSQMKRDACPSLRYMNILREGAQELGLEDDYQQWLLEHPVQTVPKVLQRIAVRNIIWTMFWRRQTLLDKLIPWTKIQSWLLFRLYRPSSPALSRSNYFEQLLQNFSYFFMGVLLLPGSIFGSTLLHKYKLSGKVSPMLTLLLNTYE